MEHASQGKTSGLPQESVGGDQHSYSERVGTGERAASASGRRGRVTFDGLLPTVGEVEIPTSSSLAVRSRKISTTTTAAPNLGSKV